MLNTIAIMGRLTKDPELRYTNINIPVASFTLAVDRDYGKDEKQTDFINCVAWRQTGEFVAKHFQKGNALLATGRLEMRPYTDRDGNKRTAAEVNAEHVYFCESKSASAATKLKNLEDKYPNVQMEEMEADGDLPF